MYQGRYPGIIAAVKRFTSDCHAQLPSRDQIKGVRVDEEFYGLSPTAWKESLMDVLQASGVRVKLDAFIKIRVLSVEFSLCE